MACLKGIILALLEFRKTAQALMLSECMKTILPSGDELMGIGLVTDIPDQFVTRGIEDIVEGDGQFNDPQARGQMAAGLCHGRDDNLSDIRSQSGQFRD